jgi:hypothetical protein
MLSPNSQNRPYRNGCNTKSECLMSLFIVLTFIAGVIMLSVGIIYMSGIYYCPENAQTVHLYRDILCTVNGTIVPDLHSVPRYTEGLVLTCIGAIIVGLYILFYLTLVCAMTIGTLLGCGP